MHSQAAAAELLPRFAGYVLEDACGEALALFSDKDSEPYWRRVAAAWYGDARASGHPAADEWVERRQPLTVRILTPDDAGRILADGTPLLQRER